MTDPIRILVTGEYEDLDSRFPSELGHRGLPLEWVSLPVLQFEKINVDSELVKGLVENPPDWIIFTSQRSVKFWAEVMMAQGVTFPIQTQVGCIGEKTAEAANAEGFTPDFFPTEPGSEKFLEEFEELLGNSSHKPTIFIPMAEGGRSKLRDRLSELGCRVQWIPLYRSLPKDNLSSIISQQEIASYALILFTSPSSVDAFVRCFEIPEEVRVGSIGQFTAAHLEKKGIQPYVLPNGDFERVGEILC